MTLLALDVATRLREEEQRRIGFLLNFREASNKAFPSFCLFAFVLRQDLGKFFEKQRRKQEAEE